MVKFHLSWLHYQLTRRAALNCAAASPHAPLEGNRRSGSSSGAPISIQNPGCGLHSEKLGISHSTLFTHKKEAGASSTGGSQSQLLSRRAPRNRSEFHRPFQACSGNQATKEADALLCSLSTLAPALLFNADAGDNLPSHFLLSCAAAAFCWRCLR